MKKVIVLVIIIFVCFEACCGETNVSSSAGLILKREGGNKSQIKTNFLAGFSQSLFDQKVSEKVIPLPMYDRMDFDSYSYASGNFFGEDIFTWRLIKLGRQSGLGPFVLSQYPTDFVNKGKDILVAGFCFCVNFR